MGTIYLSITHAFERSTFIVRINLAIPTLHSLPSSAGSAAADTIDAGQQTPTSSRRQYDATPPPTPTLHLLRTSSRRERRDETTRIRHGDGRSANAPLAVDDEGKRVYVRTLRYDCCRPPRPALQPIRAGPTGR